MTFFSQTYFTQIRSSITKIFGLSRELNWFIPYASLDVATINKLGKLYEKSEKEIEEGMIMLVSTRLDEIKFQCFDFFPKRKIILNDAFEASKINKYSLSIPIMISQADGMFDDFFHSKSLYTKNKNKQSKKEKIIYDVRLKKESGKYLKESICFFKKCNIKIDQDIVNKIREDSKNIAKKTLDFILDNSQNDTLSFAINNAMNQLIYHPIVKNEKMNRNNILHGQNLNYATEANNYRIISLLWLISYVCGSIKNKKY